MALVLEALRSNKTLDLGSLGVWLCALLLGLNLAADDELADLKKNNTVQSDSTHFKSWREDVAGSTHIVLLAETEEPPDLCSTLGAETLGLDGVLIGEAGDLVLSLLDDGEREDGQVVGDDAATDGLSLALAGAARSVAGVTVGEEEANTGWVHDTLLHGEALLVVSTGDLDDVALPLVTEGVGLDFLSHAAVHEDAELALVFNLNELLRAIGGVRNVQLHLDRRGTKMLSRTSWWWCCRRGSSGVSLEGVLLEIFLVCAKRSEKLGLTRRPGWAFWLLDPCSPNWRGALPSTNGHSVWASVCL